MPNLDETLDAKREAALGILRAAGDVVVALSGGVDSAVLLALAAEALGAERVLAVTAASASLPARELAAARSVAAADGVRHEVVRTAELEREGYRANAGDRCYHCRTELFERLEALAARLERGALAYGAIADDAGDFRPGMRAAAEHRVLAPLADAGMTKADVRALAGRFGLSAVEDKPASACLASRIPVGVEVTAERLDKVDRAEAALFELGFQQFRVRLHGAVARIELDAEGLERIADPELRRIVAERVRAAGFRFVTVDLEGYRTGILNPG